MTLNDAFGGRPRNSNDRQFRSGIPDQISPEEFHRLLMAGRIVDGRMGGTLLGKALGEGHARAIFKIGSDYLLHGTLEGGCFIFNREASLRHRTRLKAMLSSLTMNEIVPEAQIDEIGQLIVSTAYPHDRLVWLEFCQTVIPAEPAMKHVIELGRLNADPNPFLHCDHYEIFGCEPGPDDIV